MSTETKVQPLARQPKDVRRFLNVAYRVYANDRKWVAPLLSDMQRVFGDENPLFEHAEMQIWVAVQGRKDVGRIAAVLDRAYNRNRPDSTAFFGFFETVNDAAVGRRLLEVACAWARKRGCVKVLGPMNPTSNDECGLLVEGFERPPMFMMPWNPPHYEAFVMGAGFHKSKDLLAFHVDLKQVAFDRLARIAEQVRRRNPQVVFRSVTRKTLEADLAEIQTVYNVAWQENWGFVAMSAAEMRFLADRLKPLFAEGLVWLAHTATEPVGFLLAIPDYNCALKPLRGRLLSLGLLRALPYFLHWWYPRSCRVITLGVKPAFRNRGLEAVMLTEGLKVGRRLRFKEAEASWVLEDNTAMVRLMESVGSTIYKRYRLYERTA